MRDEAFEDEWEGTYEVHQPNTAYNFIYIYEYPEDNYALYIAREYNDSTVSFQYFDGPDIFDFSSKEEAIDTFKKGMLIVETNNKQLLMLSKLKFIKSINNMAIRTLKPLVLNVPKFFLLKLVAIPKNKSMK